MRGTAGNPEGARLPHLSRSGSQSQRRIWFILPAYRASHIINNITEGETENSTHAACDVSELIKIVSKLIEKQCVIKIEKTAQRCQENCSWGKKGGRKNSFTNSVDLFTSYIIILQTVIWNSIEFQVFFRDLECVTCLLPWCSCSSVRTITAKRRYMY